MIDIHSHFLPSIDDGAADVEESLKMLRDSYDQGVKIIVATPHCVIRNEDDIDRFLEKRRKSYESLLYGQKKTGIQIPKILLGAEVCFDNDLSSYKNIEKLCIEGTGAMLTELTTTAMPTDKLSECIFELNMRRIRPVIAHIDRYREWRRILDTFAGLYVSYQINANRFFERRDRKFIKNFKNIYGSCIISSDMHNTEDRKSRMLAAYEKAKKMFGSDADDMFGLEAERVLGIKYAEFLSAR